MRILSTWLHKFCWSWVREHVESFCIFCYIWLSDAIALSNSIWFRGGKNWKSKENNLCKVYVKWKISARVWVHTISTQAWQSSKIFLLDLFWGSPVLCCVPLFTSGHLQQVRITPRIMRRASAPKRWWELRLEMIVIDFLNRKGRRLGETERRWNQVYLANLKVASSESWTRGVYNGELAKSPRVPWVAYMWLTIAWLSDVDIVRGNCRHSASKFSWVSSFLGPVVVCRPQMIMISVQPCTFSGCGVCGVDYSATFPQVPG